MTDKIHLGISTCPNDTFAFHGLLTGAVDSRGLDFTIDLCDVEELNRRVLAGSLDVAKVSFHAALLLSDTVTVLEVGSALGYGVGPLLLAARSGTQPDQPVATEHGHRRPRVLCPGPHTTATLLYHLFHPREGVVQHAVFSDIMPALKRADAEFGVCIHEGRFTWQEAGLALVEDLGAVWETRTGVPLPLGGIVARSCLGRSTIETVQTVIRESIEFGLSHRAATLATMRRHAQELSDEVIWKHVDLYVTESTLALGRVGRRAIEALALQAKQSGLIDPARPALLVCGESTT